MNKVMLIGRLTYDPDVKEKDEHVRATFNLAVNRRKRAGEEQEADFPRCVAFGRTAELIRDYVGKGSKIGVIGEIRTGSYVKDGSKIYTTDVMVSEVEFLDTRKKEQSVEEEWQNASADDFELPFN